MVITKIAKSEDDVSAVVEEVFEEMKERLWRETWKEMIELPQAKVEVRKDKDGNFSVTVKI